MPDMSARRAYFKWDSSVIAFNTPQARRNDRAPHNIIIIIIIIMHENYYRVI